MGVLCVTASQSYHAVNYDQSLTDLCNDVTVFHYGPSMSAPFWGPQGRALRGRNNAELRALAIKLRSEGRLGVVFCSAYDDFMETETLVLFKRLGATVVNHMVDMPTQWYRLLRSARHYDCIAVAHCDYFEQLASRSRDLFYMPMAANPKAYFKPEKSEATPPSLSFVGSWSPFRSSVLGPLKDRRPELTIYGNWKPQESARRASDKLLHDVRYYLAPRLLAEGPRFAARAVGRVTRSSRRRKASPERNLSAGAVSFDVMRSVFAYSTISLGFTQSEGVLGARHVARWVRGRDFEVPMCGGFYLAQRAPEHEQHYRLGVEIETWETESELLEKIDYYEKNPAKAEAIAREGHQRALRDHAWEKRFIGLFQHLGRDSELKRGPVAG